MNEENINNTGVEQSENPEGVAKIEKKGWIRELIEREATPKPERTETIEKFCERNNISESTYDYQRRKKENKAEVLKIWLNEAFYGGNTVLRKLKERADEGDMKAIELYMKFVLELAENLEIKTDGRPIIQIVNQIATKYEATSTSSGDSQ
jgi:hypothetical protein